MVRRITLLQNIQRHTSNSARQRWSFDRRLQAKRNSPIPWSIRLPEWLVL